MGSIFKKTATKALPAGAKIIVRKGQRLAEWIDAKGKRRTAPVTTGKDGADRIVITARTYTAKYRDGAAVVQEVATGCRDEAAARSVLNELEKRADKVRAGIRSVAEDAVVDHQATLLAEHVAAYIEHQKAKGLHRMRVKNTDSRLRRLAAECGFRRLADLHAVALERWLVDRQAEGMGAGTRNEYRKELVAFGNWCIRTRRLLSNPFADVARADAKADRRRQRRALTEEELRRLLDVARRRPLEDRLTVYKGPHKGQRYAKLRPEVQGRLERLGLERALIYKTLVLTGLRKGELASVTAGQVMLDADPPYLVLDAADEKNREGSTIPLRADLAADLRQWLADKAQAAQDVPAVAFGPEHRAPGATHQGEARGLAGHVLRLPAAGPALPADTPIFTVPAGLVRILDRDLKAAGISKRDERGRTIDVHAMRHTFGTWLSKGGVTPRTAQAAMRHATIDLTMNVYTDPRLLDVAGAMEALPALPLGADPTRIPAVLRATGTDDSMLAPFAPAFAPTIGNRCKPESIRGKKANWEDAPREGQEPRKTPGKHGVVGGFPQWAITDSNCGPLPCKGSALTN